MIRKYLCIMIVQIFKYKNKNLNNNIKKRKTYMKIAN